MSRHLESFELTLAQHIPCQKELACEPRTDSRSIDAPSLSSLKKMRGRATGLEGIYGSSLDPKEAKPPSQTDLGLTLSPRLQTHTEIEASSPTPLTWAKPKALSNPESHGNDSASQAIDGIVNNRLHFGARVQHWRKDTYRSKDGFPNETSKTDVSMLSNNAHSGYTLHGGPQSLTPLIPRSWRSSDSPSSCKSCHPSQISDNTGKCDPSAPQGSSDDCAKTRLAIISLNRRVSDLLYVAAQLQSDLLCERRAKNEAIKKWSILHRDYSQLYQSHRVLDEVHHHCPQPSPNALSLTPLAGTMHTSVVGLTKASRMPHDAPVIDLTTLDGSSALQGCAASGVLHSGASKDPCDLWKPIETQEPTAGDGFPEGRATQTQIMGKNTSRITRDSKGMSWHQLAAQDHVLNVDEATDTLQTQMAADDTTWFEEAMCEDC